MIRFLEDGTLPTDDKVAREIVLSKSQYVVLDQVLYYVESDKMLRLVLPQLSRKNFMMFMMGSMEVTWCRECITCATRQPRTM